MNKAYPRIQLVGSMYNGRIKRSNKTRGLLIFENGWLSFWPEGSISAELSSNYTGITQVILMPNGINFHIDKNKYAFIPDQNSDDGDMMGIFALRYALIDLIRQSDSDLVKLFNSLKENGFNTSNRGLGFHIRLNLILSAVIFGGSLVLLLLWKIIQWI